MDGGLDASGLDASGGDAGPDDGQVDAGEDGDTDASDDGGPSIVFESSAMITLVGATPTTATLEVFARATDGQFYRRARTAGTWDEWTPAFDADGHGPSPDVASWGDGRLDIVTNGTCAGLDDRVCQRFRTSGYSTFFDLTDGQTELRGRPTIASAIEERLLIASPRAAGAANELVYRYWNGGTWYTWATLEDYPDTAARYESVAYAEVECVFMGDCTTFESYYVTSSTAVGRVALTRAVAVAGAFVGYGVEILPELVDVPLTDPVIVAYADTQTRIAVYATTTPGPGVTVDIYRLGGTPASVDHVPPATGSYDYDETNVTWNASWVEMPTSPVRLSSALDCVASSLLPSFEACAAVGSDGAVWILERGEASHAWQSLGAP